jgi:hypothetical protein
LKLTNPTIKNFIPRPFWVNAKGITAKAEPKWARVIGRDPTKGGITVFARPKVVDCLINNCGN